MHFHKINKRKSNKIIALSSAFILTISNSFSTVFANESKDLPENVVTGGLAKPYIPANAKLDSNNNPIYDEDGDFILLDEEGKEIPKYILDAYKIKPNKRGDIIYELQDYSTSNLNSRSSSKVVNLTSSSKTIRKSASKTASSVGSMPSNSVATLLGEDGAWFKVNYNNTIGWVAKDFIVQVQETPQSLVKNITQSNVNIRSSNSTSGSIKGKLPSGATATALESKNGWFRIIYGNTVGWVSSDYVKYTNDSKSASITVKSSTINNSHYVKTTLTNNTHKTGSYSKDEHGRHLYCLDPEKSSPNGHPHYKGSKLDDTTYRILKYGYPNSSFTGDATTDRIITQMALWAHIDPSRININNIVAYRNGSQNTDMLNHIKNLYNKGKNGTDTQEVSTLFSQTNLAGKFDKDKFVTDYITIHGSGDIKSASTKLTFFDTATGQQRTDISAVLENGTTVSSVSLGQKFRLVIPSSTPKGSIRIVGHSDIVHTMAYKYSPNLSGVQESALLEDVKESKYSTNEVSVTWNGLGSISITKVDANSNKKLQGAVYTITNSDNAKVATLTTDVNGLTTSPTLPFGTYKVQETKAPAGYELDSTIHTVKVNSTTPVSVTYTNKQILGSIQITKVDTEDMNKVLSGAEFTLYDSKGNVVSKATSNNKGIANFTNIPVGSYTIKETKAPNKYVLSDEVLSATIKTQGQTIPFTVKNAKQVGTVEFSKTNVSTGDIIEGATIEIKGISDNNANINISFKSSKAGNKFTVPVGKYEFKETIAPEGYVLSKEVGTFEIKENGEIVKAELKNTPIKGSVKIMKIDAEDTNRRLTRLQGAEFTLYNSKGEEISKVETDETGIAKFENLLYGEYTIKETKAPNGYILSDNNTINFKIEEHEKTLNYTVKNSRKVGEVDFSKTDSTTGELIEGATIEIKGIDLVNEDVFISFVSSKEGNKFKLPLGTYEFKETNAPEGYLLNDMPRNFEIKEHGEIVKVELKNTPITGSVNIAKISGDNTKKLTRLQGAEFTLYNSNGEELSKAITDETGMVNFENLLYGEYSIKETKAPDGYTLSDNNIINFKIENHNETLTYTVSNNRAIGTVDFSKTDVSTGEIIEGAVIEIKGIDKLNEEIYFSFISSKEGNRFDLPTGKYEFKETIAPEGYVLNEEIGTFEIKENGEIVKAELKNAPFMVDLIIHKVDYDKKTSLADAEFKLTDRNGEVISTATTDENGYITFRNLKIGSYTVTETKAPNGYMLPKTDINVEVTKYSETITLEIENKEKLAQTGGNFTISGLINTGLILSTTALLVARKKTEVQENE